MRHLSLSSHAHNTRTRYTVSTFDSFENIIIHIYFASTLPFNRHLCTHSPSSLSPSPLSTLLSSLLPALPAPAEWLLLYICPALMELGQKKVCSRQITLFTLAAVKNNELCFVAGSASAISSSDSLRKNKPSLTKLFSRLAS